MKKVFCLSVVLSLWSLVSYAAVVSIPVDYEDGKTALQGVLYFDDAADEQASKRPGVIVVHEWKGLGDYAKKRAEMLAEKGYVAFAADMYGKGVFAKNHEEAGQLAGVFFKDRDLMRKRADAAALAFIKTGKVDTDRIAAIGYCFGGTTVLEMARSGMPLEGVASFHGALATPSPAQPGALVSKIVVFNGAEDKMISAADIQAFQDEMRAVGADWQLVNFGGAKHSFTVWDANMPEKGIMYNEAADKRSWAMLLEFLDEIFEPKN